MNWSHHKNIRKYTPLERLKTGGFDALRKQTTTSDNPNCGQNCGQTFVRNLLGDVTEMVLQRLPHPPEALLEVGIMSAPPHLEAAQQPGRVCPRAAFVPVACCAPVWDVSSVPLMNSLSGVVNASYGHFWTSDAIQRKCVCLKTRQTHRNSPQTARGATHGK